MFLQQFPGQKYSIDQQCQMAYGNDSFYCAGGGERDFGICRKLFCWIKSKKGCYDQPDQNALDGTSCGNKKWCMRSNCQSHEKAPATADDKCIYGDSKFTFRVNKKNVVCGNYTRRYPELCYLKYYRHRCCKTCAEVKDVSFVDCEYGNRIKSCQASKCPSAAYRKLCCFTCRKHQLVLTPTPLRNPDYPSDCPDGNYAQGCSNLFPGQCYQKKKYCCLFCKRHFKAKNPEGCEYGNRASWCGSRVKGTEDCRNERVAESCCETCHPHLSPDSIAPACPNGDDAFFCKDLKSYMCYFFKETCCQTCSKYFKPHHRYCEYGDRPSWCGTYVMGAKECNRPDVFFQCCRTCVEVMEANLEKGAEVDTADYCEGVFAGYCYHSLVAYACPATCKKHLDPRNKECPYGDKMTWCEAKDCKTNPRECCKTCASEPQ